MRINQNVLAIRTHGQITQTNDRLDKSVEKLSSGLRINRAADDAAGLAISEKLRRQVRGLSRAILNAQDGISMIQTGEGALNESQSILQRMRELAIQASNDTLTSNDRLEIQKEVNQLRDDLNRISSNTEFNTKKLLDGSQTALFSSSSSAVKGMIVGYGQNGGDAAVSMALISGGVSQMQRSQIFTVRGQESMLAKGSTQLQSIAQFYDANGVFTLQSAQQLTLMGNSKSTTITIDGQMTLDRLAAQLQNALTTSTGLGLANSRVSMINTAVTGVAGMGGYFQMISGSVGEVGEFGIAGDQGVLNALGVTVTREAVNSMVELTLRDASGNMRQVRTSSDRATGLLDGIDVQFKSQAAQMAGVGGLEAGLNFANAETFTIRVGGVFTVNASIAAGDWTLEGITRNLNSIIYSAGQTLGGNGPEYAKGLKATVVDGQIRINWEPPSNVSSANGTIQISGASAATTIGFLNGTYSGFIQGSKNESQVVWGYTRYNAPSTQITAGTVINLNLYDGNTAGTTLAFALDPTLGTAQTDLQTADMKRFTTFQASINQALQAAGIKIRVDQVGSTMAFTSLRVGRENRDGQTALESVVQLTVDDGIAGVTAGDKWLAMRFGIEDGQARGSGDANFQIHIVDNTPQFQIGADQGQSMKVSFANMSAESLGVDKLDMTTIAGAQKALAKLNQAIDKVSAERSKLGAFQNRLEYAINNLRTTHTNLTAAESRLRDVDVSKEMIEFTRSQIISQSGMAMLAQANTLPQGVLQLLR